jgi:hypothetical protein
MFTTTNLGPEHDKVLQKMIAVYGELFQHDGYGTLRVEMRFLKKGQKEVLINCGKEYRFVLSYPGETARNM